MSKYPSYWLKAIKILSKRDKVLKRLILKYNDKFLTTRKDIFYSLCKSIVGQQISVSAANSVFKKFQKKTKRINPLKVSKLSISQLKSCGLSRQKALGIKELSIKFVKKEFDPKLIKVGVDKFNQNNVDVVSNVKVRTFPKGQSVEILSLQSLINLKNSFKLDKDEKEHVTTGIYKRDQKAK